jgi:hypothetical protein
MEIKISQKTGTYADALHAIGAADLLYELCQDLPQIIDEGVAFRVLVSEKRPPVKWEPPNPGYPYIWDSKTEEEAPAGDVLDYRAEVEKRNAIRELSKHAVKAKARKQLAAQIQRQDVERPPEPKAELAIASMLASMRKGWSGDRQLYRWLTESPSRTLAWTKFRLNLASERVADPPWSNTQFLNPITGKGVHSAKTVAKSANAINSALIDPFEDWLKLRACFKAMLAYREGDDFKFFVVQPSHIANTAIERVVAAVREMNLWGGVRLDILAILRATETLIAYSDLHPQGSIAIRGKSPQKVVAGLWQAYFKSLGTAAALMNNALFPLPDWFELQTPDDATKMVALIHEFIGARDRAGCLSSLDVKHSDDGAILQQFRTWLNSGELSDFLSFDASFAVHLIQRRTRQEWARPLSTENLTFLFSKGYNMTDVVSNPGFLSIARAIRNATIYSVGERSVDIDTRFGLAQKWKQKLKGGAPEFLGAVGEFVQEYNWEVINRRNRKYHVVSTTDLDQLAHLVQEHGVETVGLLLLAYGYAQAPKTEAKVAAQGAD